MLAVSGDTGDIIFFFLPRALGFNDDCFIGKKIVVGRHLC